MDLQQAPLQNSRTCPPPLTQLWPSCCIGISRRLGQSPSTLSPNPLTLTSVLVAYTPATMPTIAVDKYALYEALGQK